MEMNFQETVRTTNHRNIFLREPLTKQQFAQELIFSGTNLLNGKTFTIDGTNKHIINFMFTWLNNIEHGVNRNAGILISGKIGAGKSILMRAFLKIIEAHTGKIIYDADCKNFNMKYIEMIENTDNEYFKFRPMYFDDLGREGLSCKHYGTDISPVTDVLFQRYDTGAYTFATSNYSLADLQKRYGLAMADRLGAMFNEFEMKNESRRK